MKEFAFCNFPNKFAEQQNNLWRNHRQRGEKQMRNTFRFLANIAFLASIIIIGGTACQQSTGENNPKSQVSESGEPRLVVQRVVATGTFSSRGVFSNDGKLFALSNCDLGEVSVFDVKTGKEIRRFNNFTNYYSGNGDCGNLISFLLTEKRLLILLVNIMNQQKQTLISSGFLTLLTDKSKKILPVFSGLRKSISDEKEFKKSLENSEFHRLPNGGISRGESSESFKNLFPDAVPLSEAEKRNEIKKELDKYQKENWNHQLMRFTAIQTFPFQKIKNLWK
ncbi:MAG: hypothetical protein IPJ30_26515 [Acidobacteria bacterium]|nr:hypothetical protein [Acidobacteriota bacterium]